jgi:hypothetical protein
MISILKMVLLNILPYVQLSAVESLHDRHRDIRPGNFMIQGFQDLLPYRLPHRLWFGTAISEPRNLFTQSLRSPYCRKPNLTLHTSRYTTCHPEW